MGIAAFFGMANISGTLVLDELGRLVVLAEGVAPRPGDVVLELLDNEPDGNLQGFTLVQADGEEQSITIDATLTQEAADIIAQIEAGGDPTLGNELAAAAGETQSQGSATTTTATVDATLDQVLAATFFETLGLSRDFLTPTQTNTLIDIIANVAPVTQFVSRNFLEESQDGELNLTYPTDADGDALTIIVTELPVLGSVTLADGTPLVIGQELTQEQFESLQYDAPQEYTLGDNVGQFTYSVDDGTGDENSVQLGGVIFSVTPINDIPVIEEVGTGQVVESGVEEEGNPIATGFIEASDNDTDAVLSYSVDDGNSEYGQLTVDAQTGAWTFTLNNTLDATQALKQGEETSVDFTVLVTDDQGAQVTETLTITIQGTNDLPVILDTSDLTGNVIEAGHLDNGTVVPGTPIASGTLQGQDVDADAQLTFTALDGDSDYGTLVVQATGEWSFTLNNESAQTQGLMEGETLDIPFTVEVTDEFGASSTRTLIITVEGTNDKPEFTAGSELEGSVTEAGTEQVGSAVATGTLVADDVDDNATQTYTLNNEGTTDYGVMVLQANGQWTFTLNDTLPATQALVEGQVEQLTFPVTVTDEFGATDNETITITITGSNDAAIVSGLDSGNVVEDSGVTEAGLLTEQGQLTISDVDAGEELFDPDSVTAIDDENNFTPVGTLTIDETGAWNYQIDNNDPSVQSLPEGVTRTETFQVLTEDGTPHNIVITITGVNDVPTIVSGAGDSVTEDAQVDLDDNGNLVATNTLVIDDADSGEEAFNAGTAAPVGNTLGSLSITASGDWTYSVDNSLPQIQALDVGTSLTESFVVTSVDGTEHTIEVQVFGTEDPSIISSYEPGLVVEDTAGILTDTGDIDIADLDAGEALFDASRVEPQANGDEQMPLGSLTISETGQWSYQVDNSLTGVQELGDGDSRDEVFRVYSIDGSVFQDIVVTIQGVNGVPTIVSGEAGSVTEDVEPNTSGNLVATDTLVISDEDAGEAVFNPGTATPVGTTLGSLTIDAAGVWTYTVDNNLPAVQGLDVGDSVVESFVVTSEDGTEHTISVTLNGAEDETFITGYAPDEVTEDSDVVAGELIGSGSLTISDKDFGEDVFDTTSVTPVANNQGQLPLGNLTITSDGDWTYKVVNSLEGVQELGAGDTRVERFEVSSIDGTASQIIEVTINGTDDEPVIAGDGVGSVIEDTDVMAGDLLKDNGQLTIDDPDAGESLFDPDSVTPLDDDNELTPVGTLTIDETGAWSYQIDNNDPSVQSLPEGVTRTETFRVLTEDGSPHNIVITITGTNDLPMIGGTSYGLMTEDESSQIDDDGNLFFNSQATITDVDSGEGAFIPSSVTPALGNFTDGALTIDAAGNWSYKIPNSSSNVQGLAAGETVTQTFTVTTDNQTTHTITVDIVGVNDASVLISSPTAAQGYVIENETPVELRDNGTLILRDVDGVEQQVFQTDPDTITSTSELQGATEARGILTINPLGEWNYSIPNGFVEYLADGELAQETFTVLSADGTPHVITITIEGTNDVPVIVSGTRAEGTEDQGLEGNNIKVQGTAVIDDADTNQNTFQAGAGSAAADNTLGGTLTIDAAGNWTYLVDNTQDAVQSLDVGDTVTETFTVLSFDGTPIDIVVTVNGAEDETFITDYESDTVYEDDDNADGELVGGGTLTISDLDADEDAFDINSVVKLDNGNGQQPLGELTITAQGTWTYKVVNSVEGVQQLENGETRIERFQVSSIDGSKSQIIEVTIVGTDDEPVIAGDGVGAVTEDFEVTTENLVDLLTDNGQLTISDADSGQSLFDPDSVTKVDDDNGFTPIGSLTITAQGAWEYEIDNNHPSVQSLGEDETRTETFQVLSEDGSPHNIVITITGVNDIPTIVSGAGDSVTEDADVDLDSDGNLVASNTLVIVDADIDQNTFNAGIASPVGTVYGELSITSGGVWTYKVDNSLAQIQALDTNTSITESFVVTSVDGTEHTINVQVFGAEDPSIISSYEPGLVVEDTAGILTDTGDLDISDLDAGEALFDDSRVEPQANNENQMPLGTLTITDSGQWSYQVDNSLPGVQELGDDDSRQEVFRVYSIDGSVYQDIVVTIQGVDGEPSIVSGEAGSVTEDVTFMQTNNLVATNTLVINDEDAGENTFNAGIATPVGSTLGSLTITAAGVWTYTIDNSLAAVQALDDGDVLEESFTVTSLDGTPHTITVQINGAEDETFITNYAPDIVYEDDDNTDGELVGGGTLTISDLDAGEAAFDTNSVVKLNNLAGQQPLGELTITANGVWTYKVVNSVDGVQELGFGDTRIERFQVSSIDGSKSQIIEVTIVGTDDEPTIAGNAIGAVKEDTLVDSDPIAMTNLLRDNGQITIDDADMGQSSFKTTVTKIDDGNGLTPVGTLTINAQGAWDYVIDNDDLSVQSLPEGVTRTETFRVETFDGTPHDIVVTITGTNDLPMIGGVSYTSLTEDNSSQYDDDQNLSFSAQATISDVDIGEGAFIPSSVTPAVGNFIDGNLTIDALGNWTYTIPNNSVNVQQLNDDETVRQTFTVLTDNNTTHTIIVDITGVNDGSVVINPSEAQGYVYENDNLVELTDSGTLILEDADGAEEEVFQTDPDTFTTTSTLAGSSGEALGTLEINALGEWDYTIANGYVNYLRDGETATETFTVLSKDGTPHTVTITIEGINDVPVITSGNFAEGTEDAGLVGDDIEVEGTLIIDDPDQLEDTFKSGFGVAANDNTLGGTLEINADGTWTYLVDNNQAAVQSLDDGDFITETFTVRSIDDTPIEITVKVNGVNDPTIISTPVQGNVFEDDSTPDLIHIGNLTVTDVDTGENKFDTGRVDILTNSLGTSSLGSVTITDSGTWTYKINNSLPQVQTLGDGDSFIEYFRVYSIDGSASEIVEVKVNGTNDTATIEGNSLGQVVEDITLDVNQINLKATGFLSVSDIDAGEDIFSTSVTKKADATDGMPLGNLTITAGGTWTYTVDNSNSTIQSLALGETRTERFVVSSSDGTATEEVVITVYGTNDIPTISVINAGTPIYEDSSDTPATSGDLDPIDVDTSDIHTWSLLGSNQGQYGTFDLDSGNGTWDYYLVNDSVEFLQQGERVFEYFQVKVDDGKGGVAFETVAIEIIGTNDQPEISGDGQGLVIEDGGALSVTKGNLEVDDVDIKDVHTWRIEDSRGLYGDLTIDSDGEWTYTLNQKRANFMEEGVIYSEETFTVIVEDGNGGRDTFAVNINIEGNNDAPNIKNVGIITVEEDINDFARGRLRDRDPDENEVHTWVVLDANGDTMKVENGAGVGVYGNMSIEISNSGIVRWRYDMQVTQEQQDATQALELGEEKTETFTVQVTDKYGAKDTQLLTVKVIGTNDTPIIEGVISGDVTEDVALTTSGTLEPGDVDTNDTHTWSLDTDTGDYGSITLITDPITGNATWTYTLNNDNPAVQALHPGDDPLTETFTVKVVDDSIPGEENPDQVDTQVITINIHGNNDAPTLSGETFGSVIEPLHKDFTDQITVSGDLVVSDIDNRDVARDALGEPDGYWFQLSVDNGDPNSDNSDSFTSNYGTLQVDSETKTWTYVLDNLSDDTKAIPPGTTVYDTFTVVVTDELGASSTIEVQVAIAGTNTEPLIQAVGSYEIVEDGAALQGRLVKGNPTPDELAQGDIGSGDLDIDDEAMWQVSSNGKYGIFDISDDGLSWTYTLFTPDDVSDDPSRSAAYNAVNALSEGEPLFEQDEVVLRVTDEFGITKTQTLQIDIIGANDMPNIGGFNATFAEDNLDQDIFSATGQLTDGDVDANDTHVWALVDPDASMGQYGTFVLQADGTWTYNVDPAKFEQIQDLNPTDSDGAQARELVDTFEVQVTDMGGSGVTKTETFTLTITADNDLPVVTGDTTGSYVEDSNSVVFGTATLVDRDNNDQAHFLVPDPSDPTSERMYTGLYGNLTINASGQWTYTPDDAKLQSLAEGQPDPTIVDSFFVLAQDTNGATITQEIVIDIIGNNDIPEIDGDVSGIVYEDGDEFDSTGVADFTKTEGQLFATDIDQNSPTRSWSIVEGPDSNAQSSGVGQYGTLTLDNSGKWVYVLDNGNQTVQDLDFDSDPLTETFYVVVSDNITDVETNTPGFSEPQRIDIEIYGQNEPGSGGGSGSATLVTVDVKEDSNDQTETQTVLSDISQILPIQGGFFGGITFEPLQPADPDNPDAQQWTYTLDNDNPIVQALDEGEVIQEVWRIATESNGVYQITVNIEGTADEPQIFIGDQELQDDDVIGEVIEDSAPFTSGRLSVEDADANEQFVWSVDGDTTTSSALGTITIDPDTGEWSYQLSDDVQLAPGEEVYDYFDVRATDTDGIGTPDENSAVNSDTHQIRIKIIGTSENVDNPNDDDKPLIAAMIQTYEDPQDRDPALSTISTGTLTLNTLEDENGLPVVTNLGDDIAWTLVNGSSPYGSMVVSEDGSYTFTLNNNSNAVQRLADGEVVQQVFEVYAIDQFGKTIVDEDDMPQTLEIVVNIEGSNDAPTVSTLVDSLVAETDSMDVQSISGNLQSKANDIDNDSELEWSQLMEVDVPSPDYGNLVVNDDGSYVFTLNTTNGEPHPDIVALNENEPLTLKWSVLVTDNQPGTVPVEQMIEITLFGTNELPEITTSLAQTVFESDADDNQTPYQDATPDIVQQIVLTDRDSAGDLDDVVTLDPKELFGTYGVFQVDPVSETWSYTLYNEPHVHALAQGVSVMETFAIRATDDYGGEVMAFVDVTITGTNDAPMIEGTVTGTVVDEVDATASGQLVVADMDAGDTHTFSWPAPADLPDGVKNFAIDANGIWTLTLDSDADVVKNLPKGETTTLTVNVTATDLGGMGITSAEQAIVVTVVGNNDAPVIQDIGIQNVIEDTLVTLSGTFDSGDPDNEINPDSDSRVDGDDADNQTWQVVSGDSRGSLVVNPTTGAWTFELVDSFDYLAEGETLATPLQYVVQVTDEFGLSDQQTIEFQVTGSNDAPTIDTVNTIATGTVYEDPAGMETDSAQGIITFEDLDITDTHSLSLASGSIVTSLVGDYGTLTLVPNTDKSVRWEYALNQNVADSLKDVLTTDTFNLHIESQTNGMAQQDTIITPIVVTIDGNNDAPVITTAMGQDEGTLVEDSGPLSATGTLSATDSEAESLTFSFTPTVNNPQSQYGSFEITSGGTWTYTLDASMSQALNTGSITETFEVEVSDGTNTSTDMVTVTLQGNNDAPIITTSVAQRQGTVTEDLSTAQTATGTLTASDPESQTVTYSFSGAQSQYGQFSVSSGGVWNYVLNGNSQMLNVDGDSESFVVDVTDGVNQTTETITITFVGSNDLPVINGVFLGDVQEGVKESVSGTLTATDVDGPNSNISRVLNGGVLGGDGRYTKVSPYGSLTFDPLAGTWVYLLIASDSLPSLGTSVFDTFTVDVADGSGTVKSQEIRIEVAGNNVVRGESNMEDLLAATSDDEWLFGNDIATNGNTTTDTSVADEFKWDATALGASGEDIIKDFDVHDPQNPSQPHDVINLKAVVFDSDALLTEQILLSEVDNNVVIEINTSSVSQTITLEDVSLAALLGVDATELDNISPANMLVNLYQSGQLQLDESVIHIGTSGDDGDAMMAFTGSAGSDIIYGAGGNDILVGNGGNDLFLFTEEAAGMEATPSMQTVNDFSVGSDLLDISDLLPEHEDLDDLLSNIEIEVNDAQSAMESSSTVIKVSNGDGHTQITLEGIGSDELGIMGGAANLDQGQLLNQLSEVMNVIKVDP